MELFGTRWKLGNPFEHSGTLWHPLAPFGRLGCALETAGALRNPLRLCGDLWNPPGHSGTLGGPLKTCGTQCCAGAGRQLRGPDSRRNPFGATPFVCGIVCNSFGATLRVQSTNARSSVCAPPPCVQKPKKCSLFGGGGAGWRGRAAAAGARFPAQPRGCVPEGARGFQLVPENPRRFQMAPEGSKRFQ